MLIAILGGALLLHFRKGVEPYFRVFGSDTPNPDRVQVSREVPFIHPQEPPRLAGGPAGRFPHFPFR